MEEEVSKHFSRIRFFVTIALLGAFLSFAFSYILFKNVNVPLDQMQIQKINTLEDKVNQLVTAQQKGSLDLQLQMAILNMQKVANNSSGDVQAEAQKVVTETKAILEKLRGKTAPTPTKK